MRALKAGNIWALMSKELLSQLVTPLLYVVLAAFTVLVGFFFFINLQHFNAQQQQLALLPNMASNLNESVVQPYWQTIEILLLFVIPVLAARSFPEEKQRGTFELLMTSPLSLGEIVLGKFFGFSLLLLLILGVALLFPVVLLLLADPEAAPIFVGFFGLSLFALGLLAINISLATLLRNQTLASFIGMVISLFLFFIEVLAGRWKGILGEFFKHLSPAYNSEWFLKGVISVPGIIYFLSLMVFGVFLSIRMLEAERWR